MIACASIPPPVGLNIQVIQAVGEALESISKHEHPGEVLLDFAEPREIVGFDACHAAEQNHADRREP